MQKDLNSAKEEYKLAVKCDSSYYLAYHNLGVLSMKQKKYKKAVEKFKKVIELNPDALPLWY